MGRNREPESSLELLLDTMCNTFGGVMFIAIALVVVVSMARPVVDALNRDLSTEVAELSREAEALERELAVAEEASTEKQALERLLAADPRRHRLEELALLQSGAERRRAEVELLRSRLAAEKLRLREKERMVRENTAGLRQVEERLEQQQEALEMAEARRRLLEAGSTGAAVSLNFRRLEESSQLPFYLLVCDGRVWKVGPWRRETGFEPDEDVSVRREKNLVICTIRPGAGVPLLEGEELSPAFRALLATLPADRVPDFRLEPKSAAAFCRAREVLKRENVPHGCNTVPAEEAGQLVYQPVDEAVYEY